MEFLQMIFYLLMGLFAKVWQFMFTIPTSLTSSLAWNKACIPCLFNYLINQRNFLFKS